MKIIQFLGTPPSNTLVKQSSTFYKTSSKIQKQKFKNNMGKLNSTHMHVIY